MSHYDNLITALLAMLAQITVVGGYNTDAGQKVWLNLEYQTAPPQKPCVILFPGEVSDSLSSDPVPSFGEENHSLPLKIEAWITDSETGSQGQALRQDILKAFNADRSLGGLVELIDPNISSEATVEEGGEEGFISFVQVEMNLLYVTLLGVS